MYKKVHSNVHRHCLTAWYILLLIFVDMQLPNPCCLQAWCFSNPTNVGSSCLTSADAKPNEMFDRSAGTDTNCACNCDLQMRNRGMKHCHLEVQPSMRL